VIIAILAAIGVPALTGYIEKAHEKELIAVANTSVKALQAWATEQYAYGNVGDEGLRDQYGDPVSLASYTGESKRFSSNYGADGGIVTADYHSIPDNGVMDQTGSSEGMFFPAAVVPGGLEWIVTITLRYHFVDKSGAERIETFNWFMEQVYVDEDCELTYADVACGMPKIEFSSTRSFTPPLLPEGYSATEATQGLIGSGAALKSTTHYWDYNIWEGTYTGDLYYEDVSSLWVKVVDRLASTDYESEGYVVTEVKFSGQNLLTHMKLTGPDGDFVVYANETYHYNADPTDGSSV
jgi:hypothetical protein